MSADLATLRALKEQCERATGPDRGLDRVIGYHVEGRGVAQERLLFADIGVAMWIPDDQGLTPYDKARGDRIRQVWQKGTRRNPGRYVPQRMYACAGPMPLTDSPDFTASIDAALALMGKVLPGWWWACGVGIKSFAAKIGETVFTEKWSAEAATPALAILSCLLQALIFRAEEARQS
jgi:hypothetical protein